MKALITGASSGIGRDMAIYLSQLGYDTIIVARREKELHKLKTELNTKTTIIPMDLSKKENCVELYNKVKDENIDVLINNAGFGLFGEFTETDLEKELTMIDTNITALHILTKLFLWDMKQRNSGYILNVASLAGFMPGPLMATYYATKGYVVRLTQAIKKELQKTNSNVSISLLCPGPVDTNFNNVANVKFGIKPHSSKYVAKYGIDKMFKIKTIIVPGALNKICRILSKPFSDNIISEVVYKLQTKKR